MQNLKPFVMLFSWEPIDCFKFLYSFSKQVKLHAITCQIIHYHIIISLILSPLIFMAKVITYVIWSTKLLEYFPLLCWYQQHSFRFILQTMLRMLIKPKHSRVFIRYFQVVQYFLLFNYCSINLYFNVFHEIFLLYFFK